VSDITRTYQWRIIGRSERGASHVRHDLPNQDAIQWELGADGRAPALLAVADGHGSPKSFRSNVGAELAVEVTIRTLRDFLVGVKDATPSVVKNRAEQQFPVEIAKNWREEVSGHFQAHPFTPEELDRLEKEAGTAARQSVTADGRHFVVYGATILAIAVTDSFILYAQLGDGEILTVPSTNGESVRPMPPDAELIANETTSLCMDEAWQRFRIRFQHLHESVPAMIMLSTDGYPNSFRDFEGFAQAGTDLLKIFAADGSEAIERDLPSWLTEASTLGSGDDVTLGLLFQVDPAPIEDDRVAAADEFSPALGSGDTVESLGMQVLADGSARESVAPARLETCASVSPRISSRIRPLQNYLVWLVLAAFIATSVWLWMQHDRDSNEFQWLRREVGHLNQELTNYLAWLVLAAFFATSVWLWIQHHRDSNEFQRLRREIEHLNQELISNKARVAALEVAISRRDE